MKRDGLRFGLAPGWTQPMILDAMRRFEAEQGRWLSANDVMGKAAPAGMPSGDAIRRHFGSFRAACELAYGGSREPGGGGARKDTDTEAVIVGLYGGRTLVELAAERDISPQALGRRVRRYQAAHGLAIVNRPPGRPKAA